MNFTSRIYNTSAIYYYASQKEKEAHLIGKLPNVAKSSPKKPTDGKETTKNWVLQSFYPKSHQMERKSTKAADNNSATVASNLKPSASTSGDDKTKSPAKKKIPGHKGEPTVRFAQSLINSHGEKFKFCVVGKFQGSRPSLAQIRKWVAKEWKLKGDCFITLLDPHHIFVRLESQEDMIYVWSRNRWLINGRHLMKVFKWSTKFRPAAGEPSLAAVWISLPLLPVVFFQEELLFSVASVVGRVLAMDGPTRNLTRTNVARVCLEVDLLKELPRRVRIEVGDEGFWQDIDYEKLPSFCTVCQQQGHSIEICKFNKKDSVEEAGNLNSNSSLANPNSKIKNGRCSEVLVTEVKHAKFVIGDKTENGQAVTEGSCHLPLNGCSLEESSKMKKVDASDNRGECSDVVTTEQSLTANGPSKLSANQVAVLEKTDDLLKVGTSKVVQDEKLQGENTLLQVEEEEVEEEEEEKEEGKCDDDGDLVHIETKRSDKAEENHRGEETESVTNKRRKKSPGRTSLSSRRKSSSNKPIFFWKRKQKYTHPVEAIPEVASLIRYSYSDVKKMTKSFREVIGNGGFCEVYKGELPDGHLVAVKVMNVHEHFMNEINIMKRTSHVNIVSVLGFCLEEPRRAIVYEFLPNASLDKLLYPQEGLFSLGDEVLHQIAVGVARGLGYLHHGCSTSIVHFDIKPGNILLDQNFRPKICDFGLARLWPNDWTCTVSRIAGTIGYIAPELFREHNFSDKTDVYAYGTTLLEMVVRRRPIDVTAREKDLRGWVYRHLNPEGQGYIEGVAVTERMRKMILVGLWCVQGDPVLRPSFSRVVQMLEGNINELQIPPNPSSTHIFTASYSLSFEEPRYSREGNYGVNTRGVGSSESEGAISCTNSSLIGR